MIRLMSAYKTLLKPCYHGLMGFLLHWTFWNGASTTCKREGCHSYSTIRLSPTTGIRLPELLFEKLVLYRFKIFFNSPWFHFPHRERMCDLGIL